MKMQKWRQGDYIPQLEIGLSFSTNLGSTHGIASQYDHKDQLTWLQITIELKILLMIASHARR